MYLARLANGAKVALKIRRPGIFAKIDADLRLLDQLARLIENELPEAPLRADQDRRRVSALTEPRADLVVEARNIQRFARNFANDPNVVVPKVYSQWISSVMNVQEYIEGIRDADPAEIADAGLDRKEVQMPC